MKKEKITMTCDNPSVWKAKMLLTCKIALISALGVILAALSANTYADDMVVNAKNLSLIHI